MDNRFAADPGERYAPCLLRAFVNVSAASAGICYTGSVSNAFVQSMAHNFDKALWLMGAALTDCCRDLWQTDLWPEKATQVSEAMTPAA